MACICWAIYLSVRHTNITMQIAAGVPIVTVSARAGHARASTTTDTYAHFINSSDVLAADTIDRLFGGADGENVPDTTIVKEKPKMKVELVNSFRKAKMEMERLGIETYDEYLEYLGCTFGCTILKISEKSLQEVLFYGIIIPL